MNPNHSPSRRQWLGLLALTVAAGGCATLQPESVKVLVVGLEPLPGELMEVRLALKLRVQNPTDTTLNFDGLSVDLDLGGKGFASGVSDQQGQVPRFGEMLLTVPVSVSALAVLRQVLSLSQGNARDRVSYTLRGRLGGHGLGGGLRFTSSGEVDLPAGLTGR